jgi:hypothetical protein
MPPRKDDPTAIQNVMISFILVSGSLPFLFLGYRNESTKRVYFCIGLQYPKLTVVIG